MSNPPSDSNTTEERLANLEATVSRLSSSVDRLVTEFLHPLTHQSVENRRSIAALIESQQRHEEWLDEDRQDLAIYRQEQQAQAKQIQALIEASREDRKRADERFNALQEQFQASFNSMQSEIRQNQRLLLANQDKLDRTMAELLAVSRRVTNIEDAA